MILSGEFGQYDFSEGKFDDYFGEEVKEWFRFQDGNKLYIYFLSGAGCGGCVYNGPFLIIDLETGEIEKKSKDLPYAYDLILSPDKKKAVEFEHKYLRGACDNFQTCSVKLYLYDFTKQKRTAFIYQAPDEFAILECGHGCYPIYYFSGTSNQSILWLNENQIKIQLYKRDENGEPLHKKDEFGKEICCPIEYIPEGEPIVIDIRELAPISE